MSILRDLTTEDVEKALRDLLPDLASIRQGPHKSTEYDLQWEGIRFPPKMALSRAAGIKTRSDLSTYSFSRGEGSGQANEILRSLGFTIVPKVAGSTQTRKSDGWIFQGNPEGY